MKNWACLYLNNASQMCSPPAYSISIRKFRPVYYYIKCEELMLSCGTVVVIISLLILYNVWLLMIVFLFKTAKICLNHTMFNTLGVKFTKSANK